MWRRLALGIAAIACVRLADFVPARAAALVLFGLVLFLVASAIAYEVRWRRVRRASPLTAPEPEWEDCPASVPLGAGAVQCGERKGHNGQHEGGIYTVKWTQ